MWTQPDENKKSWGDESSGSPAASLSLRFDCSERQGAAIFDLTGAVDSPTALEPVLEAALQCKPNCVILVLNGVDYINSVGFGSLIHFSDSIIAKEKTLYVVGLQAKVHVVFTCLGAHKVLNVLATLDEALARLEPPAESK